MKSNRCFHLNKSHGPCFLRILSCAQKIQTLCTRLHGGPICPIHNVADKEFLTNEVFRLRDLLIRAQQEHENSDVLGGGGGRNWQGNVPYLQVIMCLTQDNVKRLFLARAKARSRQELDARNSQVR